MIDPSCSECRKFTSGCSKHAAVDYGALRPSEQDEHVDRLTSENAALRAGLAASEARALEAEIAVTDLTARLDATDDPQIVEDMRKRIAEFEAEKKVHENNVHYATDLQARLAGATETLRALTDSVEKWERGVEMVIGRVPRTFIELDRARTTLASPDLAPWVRLVEAVRQAEGLSHGEDIDLEGEGNYQFHLALGEIMDAARACGLGR